MLDAWEIKEGKHRPIALAGGKVFLDGQPTNDSEILKIATTHWGKDAVQYNIRTGV